MKLRATSLLLCVLLSGCDYGVDDNALPSDADIQHIEASLSNHDCIGDLSLWERNYRFSRKAGFLAEQSLHPDLDIIEFHLRRAGTITITAGRNVMVPGPGGDWPDSNPITSIDGRYQLSSGALSVGPCKPVKQG